jgi:hypothetical protein
MAPASDLEAIFVSQLLFIRALRASGGFNSGFPVQSGLSRRSSAPPEVFRRRVAFRLPLSAFPTYLPGRLN